jgi:protein-S-isoprenylcysteine O-methyltransferase Ste14
MTSISQRIRHIFEAFLASLLFSMQTIFAMGVFFGIMSMPLLPYIWLVLTDINFANSFLFNLEFILFAKEYWVGRIIAFIGTFVLLLSFAQYLRNRHRGNKLIQSGLYSKIRHPQFTGIITITLGLTLMTTGSSPMGNVGLFQTTNYWLIQVFGYIAIAKYEDWKLQKENGSEYAEYSQKVPFLFPVKHPKRIPELLFTILVALAIWFTMLVLAYGLHIN